MGHSQEQKARNRERILSAASKRIRDHGFDGLSIHELMRSVGLTNGGFYGQFASRSALIAEALELALEESAAKDAAKGPSSLKTMAYSYLSRTHRDGIAEGCAVSALANDTARADPAIKAMMEAGLEKYFENTAKLLDDPANSREKVIEIWCIMVGAIAIARMISSRTKSDEILKIARAAVMRRNT